MQYTLGCIIKLKHVYNNWHKFSIVLGLITVTMYVKIALEESWAHKHGSFSCSLG